MLSRDQTVLVLVDVQTKLVQAMRDPEALLKNLERIIRGAQILELPILWCEQYPAGLGPTVPEVADLLAGQTPIAKMSFSCWGHERFREALIATGRRQVLLAGIEAHVCIYLTAAELAAAGYEVQVIADAVSSRTAENRQIGLERVRAIPAGVTGTETALFELLGRAGGDPFKEIIKLLK